MLAANFSGRKNIRRINALNALNATLTLGWKPFKSNQEDVNVSELVWKGTDKTKLYKDALGIKLTDSDKERINKEIAILEAKIQPQEVANSSRTKKYRGGGR